MCMAHIGTQNCKTLVELSEGFSPVASPAADFLLVTGSSQYRWIFPYRNISWQGPSENHSVSAS